MFDKKEYAKKYYEENKEKILKQHKQWKLENRDKIRIQDKEYGKKWRKNNPERANELIKDWRLSNKDKVKKYSENYREKNREKINANMKEYYLNNREKRREYAKKYFQENKENRAEYNREYRKTIKSKLTTNKYLSSKYKTDPKFKINKTMRISIGHSLKGNKAGRHWEDLVGYSLSDLTKRLKSTIPNGYNWIDFLKGKLHIDHIIPISAFEFDKPEDLQFQECWSLKNLRLLPARENIVKGGKIIKPFQLLLKI